jgi:UDPglucose--hexose-1-phosphate uridylyltransferase
MKLEELNRYSHRRWNPLTREWLLVSPHRTQRPWQGAVDKVSTDRVPAYDPNCYLCPGNERAGGVRNPPYTTTYVFENDFAALQPDVPEARYEQRGLCIAEAEAGVCRVVCFSPRHDLTLSQMSQQEVRTVVDLWAEQYRELGARHDINHVQIFENRGAMMGASNPHPHGQIWGNRTLPDEVRREQQSQTMHHSEGHCLLCDYLALERDSAERVVAQNEHFTAVVPFWAFWPFETLVLGQRHVQDIVALDPTERDALADILKALTGLYDRLFSAPFPYTMGFHQRPTDGETHPEWHLHAHFYPPLLRSATIRKHVVGYELLASSQRDITPESAAQTLRSLLS